MISLALLWVLIMLEVEELSLDTIAGRKELERYDLKARRRWSMEWEITEGE